MKLILPIEVADDLEPHLPTDTKFVRVDIDGNINGDAIDAEVYFSWLYYLKPTTLHKVLESAPQLRWHHAPNAGVNNMLTPKYLERDIILTNGAGVHAVPIAEFVKALHEGWIAGAALDTVFTEPLAPESPFWTLPNVFITPHCSTHSPKVKERSLALFLDNLTRDRHGKPLRNLVDKNAGY